MGTGSVEKTEHNIPFNPPRSTPINLQKHREQKKNSPNFPCPEKICVGVEICSIQGKKTLHSGQRSSWVPYWRLEMARNGGRFSQWHHGQRLLHDAMMLWESQELNGNRGGRIKKGKVLISWVKMPEKTQKWVKHVQPLGGMRIRERDRVMDKVPQYN